MSATVRKMVGAWEIRMEENIPKPVRSILKNRLGAEIESIICLAEQIVAGTNYLILAKMRMSTLDQEESLVTVVVNVDPENKAKILSIKTIARRCVGGYDFDFKLGLPEDVATGFGNVFGSIGILGADYEPLAYLGAQIVNGTNHMILSKQTLLTKPATEHLVIVVLHAARREGDIVSQFSLLSIENIV